MLGVFSVVSLIAERETEIHPHPGSSEDEVQVLGGPICAGHFGALR